MGPNFYNTHILQIIDTTDSQYSDNSQYLFKIFYVQTFYTLLLTPFVAPISISGANTWLIAELILGDYFNCRNSSLHN